MTSSGMKRGLAASAVTALAVAGLPFLTVTANAAPFPAVPAAVEPAAVPAKVEALDATELIDAMSTPGRPVTFTVKVTDDSTPGVPMAGQVVTLRTDHGFFTPTAETAGDLVADPVPVAGSAYGEWQSLGDEITVTTDVNGLAKATVAIERDAGFDDDGRVDSAVTMAVGALQEDEPLVIGWDTLGEPLNQGSVTVALAGLSKQASRVLPDARIDQAVGFNVFARDQFGNLVDDAVEVTDDNGDTLFSYTGRSNFASTPAVAAYSLNPDEDQQLLAEWTNATTTWGGDGTTPTVGTATRQDGSETIHWYTVDFASSAFRLTSSPTGDTARVGTAVRQTVTVKDQEGQPVDGLDVAFARTGPATQSATYEDPDGTDANGASAYSWIGSAAGTARVTASVSDTWDRTPSGAGVVVDEAAVESPSGAVVKQLTAAPITFERVATRVHIVARLAMSNNRRGDDVAVVTAPASARGAVVTLYKVNRNGTRVFAGRKVANRAGDARFVISDADKRSYSNYQAIVRRTARTFADWTPVRRVR